MIRHDLIDQRHYAKGFVQTTWLAPVIVSAVLFTSGAHAVQDHPVKPPIRGLVSMGAFEFVGSGGDPVNTLEPLNAKPGIFGALVLQPDHRPEQKPWG